MKSTMLTERLLLQPLAPFWGLFFVEARPWCDRACRCCSGNKKGIPKDALISWCTACHPACRSCTTAAKRLTIEHACKDHRAFAKNAFCAMGIAFTLIERRDTILWTLAARASEASGWKANIKALQRLLLTGLSDPAQQKTQRADLRQASGNQCPG